MKRICTLMAMFCLFATAQNLYAQTVSSTTSTPNPLPTPSFGTPDSVKITNGFTSTNTGTFEDFAPTQTDTIMSPDYYYASPQSTIYFILNCSASNVNTAAKILIITDAGDTISATSNTQNYQRASIDYYFTFNLAAPIPAKTNFKIAVIMTLGNKAVTLKTVTTNALLVTAQAPIPLPVNFTGFSANKSTKGVALTWNVASEYNVTGYEVQRSANGSNFTKIGFVNASQSSSYNFIDNSPIETAYYRIKSIDADGKYKYSSIVVLKGQQSNVVLKAFPMPVQNQLTIQHGSAGTDSKIEVMSVDGRMIQTLSPAKGAQQTNVDLSSAKPGVYVVRFIDNNNAQSLKIVKQ